MSSCFYGISQHEHVHEDARRKVPGSMRVLYLSCTSSLPCEQKLKGRQKDVKRKREIDVVEFRHGGGDPAEALSRIA
jgi:hypothetical protein